MISEEVPLSSTDGLSLHARLERDGVPRAVLALCHPHPRFGGTMDAPLLIALRDALVVRSWGVLRFNFRGVGASEGESSTGEAEVADAGGAIAFLAERFPDTPRALAGWSFGAAVAIRAASGDGVAACAAIAPAVREKPGVTAGLPPPEEIALDVPLLVVCGANDREVSVAACREWAEAMPTARYVEMPGANHFFWGKYDALTSVVADFLDDVV